MKVGKLLVVGPLLGLLMASPLLGRRAAADASTQPFHVRIDFRPATSPAPIGFLADTGAVYGPRGNGFSYGWNADNAANLRIQGNRIQGNDPSPYTITGLAPGSGPSPSDSIYLVFGSDGSGANEYRLFYSPTQFGSNGLFLSKRTGGVPGGEINEQILAAAPFRANGSVYYTFKIVKNPGAARRKSARPSQPQSSNLDWTYASITSHRFSFAARSRNPEV